MDLVCISDTHMRHGRLSIPRCDVLVHAGDMTRHGTWAELAEFLQWFGEQPAALKVFIAGNHDVCCEADPDRVREMAKGHGLHYLFDEELAVEGCRVYGSPVTPTFRNMAFNRDRGPSIRAHWDAIPSGLDLLVTHGPPRGVLDRMVLGVHVGCVDLLERVRQTAPRVHLFGHIHEAYGEARFPGLSTRFINAANSRLLPVGQRPPTRLTL